LDVESLKDVEKLILNVDGVRGIHELRTRLTGGRILVDVHVLVDRYISVSEGHAIGERVRLYLLQTIPRMDDVIVHVDPEENEDPVLLENLPMRTEMLAYLQEVGAALPGCSAALSLQLHYFAGRVELEIILPFSVLGEEKGVASDSLQGLMIQEKYEALIKRWPMITKVRLAFGVSSAWDIPNNFKIATRKEIG
jgi:hypothetical protein